MRLDVKDVFSKLAADTSACTDANLIEKYLANVDNCLSTIDTENKVNAVWSNNLVRKWALLKLIEIMSGNPMVFIQCKGLEPETVIKVYFKILDNLKEIEER